MALKAALQENPKENAPDLIVGVLAFLAASGGPDADGGFPDLDLVIGFGAHRSIFTHSILSGAAIETGLYSIATLIGIVQKNLTLGHDPLWDTIHQNKDTYLSAESKGVSAGIAYHLFVDGTVQTGSYHDFPIPMTSEGHQGLFVANAAAEALDVNQKNETFSRQRMHTARGAKQEHVADTVTSAVDLIVFTSKLKSERVQQNLITSYLIVDHQTYRKRKMVITESIAKRLHQSHVELRRRYGHWMQALFCGKLFPLTAEQASFISVARGTTAAKSDIERAWLAYRQLRQSQKK